MSNYVQIYYHIIFSTKNRLPLIKEINQKQIYTYIWKILEDKKCKLHRIGGTEDHLHILTSLAPTICLSDLIKIIKMSSTIYIKEKIDPKFQGWQNNYSAFTNTFQNKNVIIEYIKNQKQHHNKKSFLEELKELVAEAGLEFNDRYDS